jgi:hypothetical protein
VRYLVAMASSREKELANARNRSATIQWAALAVLASLGILAVFVFGVGGGSGLGGHGG